ncbi:hypothetical protein GGQ68_002489 [Sagittula marina]|uniref:Uncharacterized protein n=1 Tax=Sagittula marina TaxID=943940 RepID=A0A7W6DN10_9RHOB|nr:hypothetical protein [Sagittula marina]MBB3986151.1 hypothetical protein [Sagittula marina]
MMLMLALTIDQIAAWVTAFILALAAAAIGGFLNPRSDLEGFDYLLCLGLTAVVASSAYGFAELAQSIGSGAAQ